MTYPSHVVAAGVILVSPAGRVLMVQTFNRFGAGLILPGGLVESDESPAAAATREVAEELGIDIDIRRLLAVEHRSAQNGRPSSLQFVFAAEEHVQEDIALTLQQDEIAEAHWVRRDHVVERHGLAGQPRMNAALKALAAACRSIWKPESGSSRRPPISIAVAHRTTTLQAVDHGRGCAPAISCGSQVG